MAVYRLATLGAAVPGDNEQVEFRERVHAVLRRHWVDIPPGGGYTAPSRQRYPWQWLWDSCFHALIWAELGDDRGLDELAQALGAADASGCVPHMVYQLNPRHHEDLWGRQGASSITGPPMYGHALAELHRRGAHVPERLLAAAADGLEFLLRRRERHAESGLVLLCHPWESGADNDPRWDDFCAGGFDERRWFDCKGELLGGIVRSAGGAPLANPRFAVASAGFSALVAFNALDLADATGAIEAAGARRLADAVRARWDGDLCTYTDAGDAEAGSGRIRTAYGLLGLLTETDPGRAAAIAAELGDPGAYGGAYGPAGVHRAEPSFRPPGLLAGTLVAAARLPAVGRPAARRAPGPLRRRWLRPPSPAPRHPTSPSTGTATTAPAWVPSLRVGPAWRCSWPSTPLSRSAVNLSVIPAKACPGPRSGSLPRTPIRGRNPPPWGLDCAAADCSATS